MGVANFGIAGMDWQQRVNWDRLREYRIERARTMMKKHGLGAVLCMYDENVRYITGTLTPGWNRLNPGLRYAMLCGAVMSSYLQACVMPIRAKICWKG